MEELAQHQSRPRLCIEELLSQSSYRGFSDEIPFDTYTRLLQSKSLYLIDIKLDDSDREIIPLLKEVVLSCQNLKVLRLDMSSRVTLGLERGSLLWWYFGLNKDDKFPPLQELVLSGYNGEWLRDQSKYDFWDWSELRTLKLQNSKPYSILQSVKDMRLCIDTLIFDDGSDTSYENPPVNLADWPPRDDADALLDTFVLNCSGVQSLHVSCVSGRLPLSTITKHGSSLKSLTIREHSRWNSPEKPASPALTAEDLEYLNEHCPYLESLAVDMKRSDQWVR